MESMIVTEDKIATTKIGYPYALFFDGYWILYDHPKGELHYLAIKEIGRTIEEAKEGLIAWGWSSNGFEPNENDLWNE